MARSSPRATRTRLRMTRGSRLCAWAMARRGRNGTGKTTLINTRAGATRQHAGSITLAGVALHKLASHERAAAGIGWVPQERNIFKSLTVDENLTAVARPGRAGRAASPWTPARVYEMF